MAMIVTLYLISANVYNAVDAPRSRGFSNIEVWMLGAQFPIMLALCEYGFVLYLKRHDNKVQNQVEKMTPDPNQVQRMTLDQTMTLDQMMTLDQTMTPDDQNQVQPMTPEDQGADLDDRIKRLDTATMIFSLLFFTTFALVYWITLLN